MTKSSDPDLFVFFNEIGIINQLATTQLERNLPNGLKASHFGVLSHFVRLGDNKTPMELASAFQVTKGAMTNTLQKLEERGLVRIKTNPQDGRSKLVTITAKGRRARADAIEAVTPMFTELMGLIPKEKVEKALPTLQEVRQILDEARN